MNHQLLRKCLRLNLMNQIQDTLVLNVLYRFNNVYKVSYVAKGKLFEGFEFNWPFSNRGKQKRERDRKTIDV